MECDRRQRTEVSRIRSDHANNIDFQTWEGNPMDIQTTGGISGPDPIQPHRISAGKIHKPETSPPAADRAEISDTARFLAMLRDVPPIRKDRVDELRALIASGKYETPERIAGAVDKLLEELG
jgi:negative regulator of flagellin synthesis FlgM